MTPELAFASIAQFTLTGAGESLRRKAYESLAVVAAQMNLLRERDHALQVVRAMQAADAGQLVFEELVREQLAPEAGR